MRIFADPNASETAPKLAFRPEIQGLRALALFLVAAYHFWFGKVSGGVDVFLLISAFLMTLSFTRKIETGQRVFLGTVTKYWAHTFKRIVPLATVTVLLVLLGTWRFLPEPRWAGIMNEARAVIFYRDNWWSIKNLVDYYAADSSESSPLRHFWSLSVQGQIFIIWPLLFALCWLLYRITKIKARLILAGVFGSVFIWSLNYSVHVTAADQQSAYFNTWARLWEFALGTLVALVLPYLKLPAVLRALMGWVGIFGIVTCGLLLDVEGNFPGFYALWPTLSAAFIILAGSTGTSWGADRILSHPSLLWLAKYSYGLYLLHWPMLVFYLYMVNREKAGFLAGLVLFAASLALSYVLTRLVENPLRSWAWLDAARYRGVALVALCMIAVVGATNAWTAYNQHETERLLARASVDNPGAKILDPNFTYQGSADAGYLPLSVERYSDRPIFNDLCDVAKTDSFGMPTYTCHHIVKNENPSKTVIAFGNSHVEQWMANLEQTGEENNWDVKFLQYNDCQVFDASVNKQPCNEWTQQAFEYIKDARPDFVFTIGTVSVWENAGEYVPSGLEPYIQRLQSEGTQLIALRDNPRFQVPHSDCETRTNADCTLQSEIAQNPDPLVDLEKKYPNFSAMDMTDIICPNGACPSAVGNVYTYRDHSHLTKTFTDSAQGFFDDRLQRALASSHGE